MKKERYIDRWLREHRRLCLYLSRFEYEWLKETADSEGVSVRQLIINVVKGILDMYEKGFADCYKRCKSGEL